MHGLLHTCVREVWALGIRPMGCFISFELGGLLLLLDDALNSMDRLFAEAG